MMEEMATIRNQFTSAKLSAADRKKYVWTLVYMWEVIAGVDCLAIFLDMKSISVIWK